jgi:transcriptional regulator with XRE-family HTH domain
LTKLAFLIKEGKAMASVAMTALALKDRLQEARKAAGLTQSGLATTTGLNVSVIQHIEQGAVPNPRVGTVRRLAKALGVTIDALMVEGDEQAGQDVQGEADAPAAKGRKKAGGKAGKPNQKGK